MNHVRRSFNLPKGQSCCHNKCKLISQIKNVITVGLSVSSLTPFMHKFEFIVRKIYTKS